MKGPVVLGKLSGLRVRGQNEFDTFSNGLCYFCLLRFWEIPIMYIERQLSLVI